MGRALLIIIISVALSSCDYNSFGDLHMTKKEISARNIDIATIAGLYDGSTKYIYDDLVIAGYVTANDKSGNFFRTFIIDDGTGAVEVRAGTYSLHNIFKIGRYVTIKAEGLCIGAYNNVLQIGLPPVAGSGYQTDYFSYSAVMDRYVYPGVDFVHQSPLEIEIDKISDEMLGRLVRIGPVKLKTEQTENGILLETPTWATAKTGPNTNPETGYVHFTDSQSVEICVVTSGYADFASERVPKEEVYLNGILSYGRDNRGKPMYLLKMRDIYDVTRHR